MPLQSKVPGGPIEKKWEQHRFALKLGRVAVFHGNRERLFRILPGLSRAPSEIIEAARIDP